MTKCGASCHHQVLMMTMSPPTLSFFIALSPPNSLVKKDQVKGYLVLLVVNSKEQHANFTKYKFYISTSMSPPSFYKGHVVSNDNQVEFLYLKPFMSPPNQAATTLLVLSVQFTWLKVGHVTKVDLKDCSKEVEPFIRLEQLKKCLFIIFLSGANENEAWKDIGEYTLKVISANILTGEML